jgi:hypothetical protein
MIINSFPKIVKDILKSLPKNDYPVLNTCLYVLDKFRYLQACMCQQISYVHWMEDIMRC